MADAKQTQKKPQAKGDAKPKAEPWATMANTGVW